MDKRIENYEKALHLIGSIFYYGNFKVETPAEGQLKKLLIKLGFFYTKESQVIAGSERFKIDEQIKNIPDKCSGTDCGTCTPNEIKRQSLSDIKSLIN